MVLRPGEEKQFDAEHMDGLWLLRKRQDGSCVYLTDTGWSVCNSSPHASRLYDCRVFRFANILPTDPLLHEGVHQWQDFDLPRREDKVLQLAMTLAVGAVSKDTELPTGEILARACSVVPEFEPMAEFMLDDASALSAD